MKFPAKKELIFVILLLCGIAGIMAISGQDISWGLPQYGRMMGSIPSSSGSELSFDTKLDTLEELGFSFTEEEQDAMKEWPEAGYADMLALAGWGEFAEDTWEWSPTSSQVYALDTEVFLVDRMYIDFMEGLLSISEGELPITDIVQDDRDVDWEEGTGKFHITLNYGEKEYSFTAEAMSDWLDVGILEQINGMLKKEGVEKRFYAAWNNLQGITVLYREPSWARRFEKATGCRLSTKL